MYDRKKEKKRKDKKKKGGKKGRENSNKSHSLSSPLKLQGFTKGNLRGHLAPVWGKNMWIKVTGGRDFNFTKICKGKERTGWGRRKDYLQSA